MTVAAVDIGSNSVRLLIRSTTGAELARRVEITSLARGVDGSSLLAPDRIAATVSVLREFRQLMDIHDVRRGAAMATSAVRDAINGHDLVREATDALGFAPKVISGDREATLAFAGATAGDAGRLVVVDIGGGSTEVILGSDGAPTWSHSYDIGSVRLTDRCISDRPVSDRALSEARSDVRFVLSEPVLPQPQGDVIGVAGAFTSLAAIHLGLEEYDRTAVHGSELTASDLGALVDRLSQMSLQETERIPSLDPKRAPVILAGAIVAHEVIGALDAPSVKVSERDLLDAVADELVAHA